MASLYHLRSLVSSPSWAELQEAGDERDGRDGNAVGDEGIGAVEEAEGPAWCHGDL